MKRHAAIQVTNPASREYLHSDGKDIHCIPFVLYAAAGKAGGAAIDASTVTNKLNTALSPALQSVKPT